jgi:hypothetical protein
MRRFSFQPKIVEEPHESEEIGYGERLLAGKFLQAFPGKSALPFLKHMELGQDEGLR